ncbi:unnamed protein product [Candida verbasci]|uniref:Large ribosomal subunit protein bL21m n=1 Tax=Candida verbasci TaxID=1227364 RepID=A0A9W4U1W8_9ASCO|nr:unnamed protein product [Candida verbasci]
MFKRFITTTTTTATSVSPINLLKYSSNGSRDLYAIANIHNLPYLIRKGDLVYLPYKLKNVKVGDLIDFKKITTIGSPNVTLNEKDGINPNLLDINASCVEITKEPIRVKINKKQRCRRTTRIYDEPYQTVIRINELRLK